MACDCRKAWPIRGIAAALGIVLALAQPAWAQIIDPQQREVQRPSRARAPAQTPSDFQQPPDIDADVLREEERAFTDGRWGADVRIAAPFSFSPEETPAPTSPFVAGREQSESWEATTEEEDPADVLGAEQARRKRTPPPQDGDPIPVEEPIEVSDGAIDLSEPYAQVSGEPGTLADINTPADIVAFSGVDAGYDPLLLQAQEINPVFNDQLERSFGYDPFAPLGTRIGSFTLFAGLDADVDYNSNLFASPVALGDTALELRPAARLASNWSAHALEVRASGDLSYHNKYPSEDDRAYLVEGLGRLDVTRFTDLQALIAHETAQESRSAINASSIGTRPNIFVDRGRAALNHRFNRLTLQLRGAVIDTSYGNNIFEGYGQSNADRNYTLFEEAFRPKWEFSPSFFVFADVALNQRNYSIPAFTDGLIRTSTGERYRAGVSFGNGAFLRGDVSLGYGSQTPDNPLLPPIDGLLLDANLTYRLSALTTVLLTAATDVAETTTAGSGGVLERQYATEVRHSFTTRFVGSVGFSGYTRDFVGADINESQVTAATGLEYYLSREMVLFARYVHTAFYTTSPNGNYTAEEAQFGVRLRN